MRLRQLRAQVVKDAREVLRDRRLLLSTLVVPLLILPLLLVVFSHFASESRRQVVGTPSKVAFFGLEHLPAADAAAPECLHAPPASDSRIAPGSPPASAAADGAPKPAAESPPVSAADTAFAACWQRHDIEVAEVARPRNGSITVKRLIDDGVIEAVVAIPPGFAAALARGEASLEVLYSGAVTRSTIAERRLREAVARVSRDAGATLIAEAGLDPALVDPLASKATNVGEVPNIIAAVLPYFIVLTAFLGANSVAQDLMAGERERHTATTLSVLPVHRSSVLVGKALVTTAVALAASSVCVAVLALGSAWLEAGAGTGMMEVNVSPAVLIATFALLPPLTLFLAALLLTVAGLARDMRQAHALAVPLNLLILIPALVAAFPGFKLNPVTLWIPVFNVALILRDVWNGVAVGFRLPLVFTALSVAAGAMLLACIVLNSRLGLFRRGKG